MLTNQNPAVMKIDKIFDVATYYKDKKVLPECAQL